jgi:hypothetical protein
MNTTDVNSHRFPRCFSSVAQIMGDTQKATLPQLLHWTTKEGSEEAAVASQYTDPIPGNWAHIVQKAAKRLRREANAELRARHQAALRQRVVKCYRYNQTLVVGPPLDAFRTFH